MLESNTESSVQVVHLITKAVSRIATFERLSVEKTSKRNLLRRGIDNSVILRPDPNVQCIVSNLLNAPGCDKDDVMRFQHCVYKDMMSLEIKSLDKEIMGLNCLGSKQRRFLKAITTEPVFKLCVDYLMLEKASWNVRCGKKGESIWKTAMIDKDDQVKSMDNWLKLTATLESSVESADLFVGQKLSWLNCLSLSKCEKVDVPPMADPIPDGDLNSDDFIIIDKNIESVNRNDDREVLGVRKDVDVVDRREGEGHRNVRGQPTLRDLSNQPLGEDAKPKVKMFDSIEGDNDRKLEDNVTKNRNLKPRSIRTTFGHPYGKENHRFTGRDRDESVCGSGSRYRDDQRRQNKNYRGAGDGPYSVRSGRY